MSESHAAGEIHAPLTFIVKQDTKPFFKSSALTGGKPEVFFETEDRTVTIHDMRENAGKLDLDRDGYDEVMAGYSLLDRNGKILWTFRSEKVNLGGGHMDCARVVRIGERLADARIALTACGANAVCLLDGLGRPLWEITGHHFESIDVVQLVVALEEHYQRRDFPFEELLLNEGRYVDEIYVRDVVQFLHKHLADDSP